MNLTDEQKQVIWREAAAAYNHLDGRRPWRIMRMARHRLRVSFGEQFLAAVLVQVILKLVDYWMSQEAKQVDPHRVAVGFSWDIENDE